MLSLTFPWISPISNAMMITVLKKASSEMKPPHSFHYEGNGMNGKNDGWNALSWHFNQCSGNSFFTYTHLVWYCSLILSRLSAFIVSQSSISHFYPCSSDCHSSINLRVFHKTWKISDHLSDLVVYCVTLVFKNYSKYLTFLTKK